MSADPNAFNAHLFLGARRPAGVVSARVKTEYVKAVRRHKRQKLHRPEFVAVANIGGRLMLGARYLCGDGCADVAPAASDAPFEPCPRCEYRATNPPWVVYAYFDRDGRPLYIGQTRDLDARNRAHAKAKTSPWYSAQVRLDVLSSHNTRDEALCAEREAIRHHSPVHNVQHNRSVA